MSPEQFRPEDMRATLTISRAEALAGTSRTLTVPGGRRVTVAVPAGAYEGQVIRVENLGEAYTGGPQLGALVLTLAIQNTENTPSRPGSGPSNINRPSQPGFSDDDNLATIASSTPPGGWTPQVGNPASGAQAAPSASVNAVGEPSGPPAAAAPNSGPPGYGISTGETVASNVPPPQMDAANNWQMSGSIPPPPPPPAYTPYAGPPSAPSYPGMAPFAAPMPVPPAPKKSNNIIRIVVLVVVVILVIVGGFSLFSTLRANQVAADHVSATATTVSARATGTVVSANSTSTAIASSASATAQVVASTATAVSAQATGTAAAYQSLYSASTRGNATYTDPLQNNTQGNNWSEGTSPSGGNCAFNNGSYDISQTDTNFYVYCIGGPNLTNFAFEVSMKITKGDAGGVIFRANRDSGAKYTFIVGSDGGYAVDVYKSNSGSDSKRLTSGVSQAVKQGANQTNLITAIAKGGTLTLYVNHIEVTTLNDSTLGSGQVGFISYPYTHGRPTEVLYNDMKVWTL